MTLTFTRIKRTYSTQYLAHNSETGELVGFVYTTQAFNFWIPRTGSPDAFNDIKTEIRARDWTPNLAEAKQQLRLHFA